MKRFVLALAVVAWACPSLAVEVQWPVNGHYYEAIVAPGGISWTAADAAATAAGRHLATCTTEAENDFVFGLIDDTQVFWIRGQTGIVGPWLGGLQFPQTSVPDANWQWVTGEPWNWTNWGLGEPNDYLGVDQDRLHYWVEDGEPWGPVWNDIQDTPSTYPIAYVTERVPEPSTLTLLGIAALGVTFGWCKRRKK